MNYYFIIPFTEINRMQGQKVGSMVFNAVQDNKNRWVCSTNSIIEFPELFEGHSFQVVGLELSDFPQAESLFI